MKTEIQEIGSFLSSKKKVLQKKIFLKILTDGQYVLFCLVFKFCAQIFSRGWDFCYTKSENPPNHTMYIDRILNSLNNFLPLPFTQTWHSVTRKRVLAGIFDRRSLFPCAPSYLSMNHCRTLCRRSFLRYLLPFLENFCFSKKKVKKTSQVDTSEISMPYRKKDESS